MPFTVKDWKNAPDTTTPISAAALEDLETRVTDWAPGLADDEVVTGEWSFTNGFDVGGIEVVENISGRVEIQGSMQLTVLDPAEAVAPELWIAAQNGTWLMGIDVANDPACQDFFIGVHNPAGGGSVNDIIYIGHNAFRPTIGLGMTPPYQDHRVTIQSDNVAGMGSLCLQLTPNQDEPLLTVRDTGGVAKVLLDEAFEWVCAAGFTIKDTTFSMKATTGGYLYGWYWVGSGILRFKNFGGGVDILDITDTGGFRHKGDKLGFYGATLVTQPEITGVRGSEAASADLLTSLETLGLVNDSTTAPEGWTDVTFATQWAHYGGALGNTSYRKMPDGSVKLRGLPKVTGNMSAGSYPLFTLPVGYRPATDHNFDILVRRASDSMFLIGVLEITTAGVARAYWSGAGLASNDYVSLDGKELSTV